jgi:hypothetical protein
VVTSLLEDPKFQRLMKKREIVASDLQRSGYTQRLIPVGGLTATVWLDAWRVTTSTWSSDVRRLCDGLIPRPRKKNSYYERKRRKMGQINTMKTNSKRRKDFRLATWNVRSLYRTGGLRITINELRKYKIAIAAIQETRWNKSTPQAFTSNGYNIYTSSFANNHEFWTAFLVDSKFNHMVKIFTPINERLCVFRKKGKFFNYSLINIHAPTNASEEEAKDQFYEQLERAYAACPSHDVKLVMGDANAKVSQETDTNENDFRLVDFAAGRQMAIKSTYFMHKRIPTWHSPDGHTFNQIDHWSTEDIFLTS